MRTSGAEIGEDSSLLGAQNTSLLAWALFYFQQYRCRDSHLKIARSVIHVSNCGIGYYGKLLVVAKLYAVRHKYAIMKGMIETKCSLKLQATSKQLYFSLDLIESTHFIQN